MTTVITTPEQRDTTHCDPPPPLDITRAVLTERDGAGHREMVAFVGWNHDSTRVYGLWSSSPDESWAEENPVSELLAYDRETGAMVCDDLVVRELIAIIAQETKQRTYSGRHH